jgi:signal peptidase II
MDGKEIFSWKEVIRSYLVLALTAGAILLVDQITKAIVRGNLGLGEIWSPWAWLEPYARIVHWKNTGAAFGIFQGFGDVFTVLAFVVSGAILYYFPQVPQEEWILRLALSLQFSGAVGNLIDRLTIGWVTDFISVGSFPVFNVADACISVGTAVLVLGMWWRDRRQKLETEPSPDPVSERFE